MSNEELTAVIEKAVTEAFNRHAEVFTDNELMEHDAFKLGYLQGYRSCIAAANRGFRLELPSDMVLKTLWLFYDRLKLWKDGVSEKPIMNLWK